MRPPTTNRRARARRTAIAALSLLVAGLGAAHALGARGGLSVTPGILEHVAQRGAVGPLTVSNTTSRPMRVSVAVRPWVQARSGAVAANRRSVLRNVRAGRSSFRLAAGGTRTVGLSLARRPRGSSLYGAIEVTGSPRGRRARGVNVAYRLVTSLRLYPPVGARRYRALPKRLFQHGSTRHGAVFLTVKNDGNTIDPIGGRVHISGNHHTLSGVIESKSILPGATVNLKLARLSGTLPSGRYRVGGILTQAGQKAGWFEEWDAVAMIKSTMRRSPMSVSKRRNGSLLTLLALAGTAIFLLAASAAAAATFPNACVNSVLPNQSSHIPVTMTAKTSPTGTVKAGASITLEEIKQELAVPPGIFLNGYRLGLLKVGLNKIPTEISTVIRGTNTVEESQVTTTVKTEAETTITDPTPEEKASGDEAASPGLVKVTYPNQTWTAGASGPIEFREQTVYGPPVPPGFTNLKGGIKIKSTVGAITPTFGCDPGEVEEEKEPKTIELETAPIFASLLNENAANRAPTANAGPNQKVSTGASVKLNGFESSDSSEESFALKYKWTQTGGPSVTLTGATTPAPTFTAPGAPSVLNFKLEVCDNGGPSLCSSDEVAISAGNLAPTANAGSGQDVDSGSAVTLNGSGSSDPNGDPLTYKWTQTGGPGVSLGGAETANATFTALAGPATLSFQLEVCDNGAPALCSTASVAVTVKAPAGGPGPGNAAPNTKLKSAKIKKRNVTIEFSSSEKGSTFLCKLDKGKFAKCKSPKTYKNLKPGKHKFEVKAIDSQGMADPSPAVKKFKIKG